MENGIQAIVIDNGSSYIKAGFSGDEKPHSIVPSAIGYPKFPSIYPFVFKDLYIGKEVYENLGILGIKFPIKNGIIENWDKMEKIWQYIFNKKLHVNPSEHPILLTESLQNPKYNREKMIQIMFETFNVPTFYIEKQSTLSIYSTKSETGIVCEIGDVLTQISPIYEHCPIPNAVKSYNFGGHEVTKLLEKSIIDLNYDISTFSEEIIIRQIKEKYAYVALDYDAELQKPKSSIERKIKIKNAELLKSNSLNLSKELFQCPELLFKPYMNGFELDCIDLSIYKSIEKCSTEFHKALYSNIILSGGTTKLKGFPERIEKEIKNLLHHQ